MQNSPESVEAFYESTEGLESSVDMQVFYNSTVQPQEVEPGSDDNSVDFDGSLPTLDQSNKAIPDSAILEP